MTRDARHDGAVTEAAVERLRKQVEAAHPNHKTMFVYVDDLRAALSALRAALADQREPKPSPDSGRE